MNQQAIKLRDRVQRAKQELDNANAALNQFVRSCKHEWPDKPTYDPIVTGGYRTEGDPPGTMGVDWRGPMYIPREEHPRWKRTCKLCGHTEETTATQEHVTKTPVFR